MLLVAPLLVAVAYYDLRYMRIPNIISLIALGLFVVTVPLVSTDELLLRVAAGAVILAVGLVLFGLRLLGGGDLKILAVLMLFIPSQTWTEFGWALSAAVLLGASFIVLLRSAPWLAETSWVTIRARGQFPLGLSIALAGLFHPFLVNALASL